jgi:hypothetical protein
MNKQILALTISANTDQDNNIMSMLNAMIGIDPALNLKLFTTKYDLLIPNKCFCVLPIYEAKYSYGTVVVWDLLSLELVLDFPNLESIVYLQDSTPPWAGNASVPYSNWSHFFDSPKVQVITDNPETAEIFALTWHRPNLLENINPESLYENI